eukprot:TRINITY_DN2513_c0_g2_i1.p1 TRINITY_DN2513_c0_g2~~TRINITY_DN2513_c0_g2_i1.p1  ORF type:complete len:1208 (-),score=390.25 TRINITY_DN2513_c0_g2_i1:68-3691(-)
MDQAQLDKLSYVSRHVDDLFDQRIQQFNTVYEAQIGWLQEFVSGKEATLKQQLEVLQTPKSKYPRRANASYAAPTPMKEFQYQPSAVQPLRVPFTPVRVAQPNTNLPVEVPEPSKAEEAPFKTPGARANGKKAAAKAAAAAPAKEEKPVEPESTQNQQEFKAPAKPKAAFKRGTAKSKTSPKPVAESHEEVIEEKKPEKMVEEAAAPVVEEKKAEEPKVEVPVLGEIAMPPAPSRPGTLRNEEQVAAEVEEQPNAEVAAAMEVEEATSGRPARSTAARRGAYKKKAAETALVEEEPAPAGRTRATRAKKGGAVAVVAVPSEEIEAPAPAEAPKRRGRPKKGAAAAAVVEVEPEAETPAIVVEESPVEAKIDQEDAKKKRKVSETVTVEVAVAPARATPPVSPAPVAVVLSPKVKSPSRLSEDDIVIESEAESSAPVAAPIEEPVAIVVSEAAFSLPNEPEPVATTTPEQQKKRTRSASVKANSRPTSPAAAAASVTTVPETDVITTPESVKRRKLSTATDAASEPQTPPPEVPVLPTEEIFSGSKQKKKSPKQSKSPTIVAADAVESKRATRSQKSSPVSSFTVSAPPSYAESLELLRKELPAIEAVLRMDREEAAASGTNNVAEVDAPAAKDVVVVSAVEAPVSDDKMDVDTATDEKSVEEPRRISGKRKRSSAGRLSSSSGAPSLVSSSSAENLLQPRAAGSSMAPPTGNTRVVPPAAKPGAAKPAATQKGAVDEKLKKVIENRNQKEQERIQKQLEKIKKQEEKQSRIAEQKTAATVQDKVKEAQRRKEELKKKQQEKKKPAAVAAAPALTKKASAEEISTESTPTDAPVQVTEQETASASAVPKSTPLKNLISKFTSSNPAPVPTTSSATAVVAPVPALVKDTPSKGSSIKSLFASLNPLSLLSSFGSAKKQKPQEELPKPTLHDDDDAPRRQSAPGSPSVSKSPLFSLTEAAKSPSRASTGSNHEAFDEPPSASIKGKKSKTPKKPASAKKVKQLFGWNKPSTLTQEPLPTPNLGVSSSSTATKKVNLSPSDLPSPGPPPAMSKTAAEIMPPPKLPAIGSPSWIRLQTKDQPAPASPYQSPEKPKQQQGKFHQSPEFQYKIDEYSSDQDSPEKMMGPEWTKKEQLWEALVRQSSVDPDDVFGTDFPKTCDLAEIFATDKTSAEDRRRYRHRTSSGNWTRDKLHAHEDLHYKKRMGFYRSPTK